MANTVTASATGTSSEEQLQHDMALASKVARAAASASTSSGSGVRLVYSTRSCWPFAAGSSSSSAESRTLDIAVLDSSFNPPSRAHLALLLSQPILADQKRCYDGHLLLFSTQNADKGAGKPGDASLSQRVEMMTLMAKDVERIQAASGHRANVAVGLVDKPLIFAKSTLTWDLLKQQQQQGEETEPRLHWVVGFDTLYRVFQLKYYPSLQAFQQQCSQFFEREGTTFVCARRDPLSYPQLINAQTGEQDAKVQARKEEDKLLASENVAAWVQRGSIGMLDIDADQATLSSTKIRALLKDTSIEKDDKKQQLKALVPPSLVEYLVESGIYGQDEHGVQG
ncbi:hypothetical protein EX895_001953 [Sporisorium graminicola]|uniref:Uncharacterized protein n=1 Tax=Sporisorium graminicola TaxID=280036 RepID=A0A4U7L2C1_9BASI|nr:hypothetical protein EX895_001953 [Sporisorium graminicola]TKY89422.1 hypothetical protein EX895_001953 [Sporisorium graminicola]